MRLFAAPLFLCALLVTACDRSTESSTDPTGPEDTTPPPVTPEFPPGTVLAVDEVPITAEEVERVADWIHVLYPEYTRPHCRQVALTEFLFYSASARAAYPEKHAEARAASERFAADPVQRSEDVPEPMLIEGDFQDLSLALWGLGNELEPGVWAGPLDRIGFVTVLRLEDSWNIRGLPQTRKLRLTVVDFPYLVEGMTARDLESLVDQRVLTIVDPEWERYVPELWKYRMRGGDQ